MNIKIINNDFINYKFYKIIIYFIILYFMNITSFLSQIWSPPTTHVHWLVHTVLPLLFLHLILTHSKGQGQDRAHFDCEYLQIWDRANIATDMKWKVACGLSIGL